MGVNQDTRALVGAFKTGGEQKNRTYQAEVTRIDDEGVVWVNVAGSDVETPTAEIAAEVKRGDSVNVEWRNNKLYIAGNYSNPSAGLARTIVVENTANDAQHRAVDAQFTAIGAQETAASADAKADDALNIAEGVNDYFWHDNTGAHVTQVPQADYEDDPSSAGGNTLITSTGMAIRDGQTELATFGANGAQIGQSGAAHSVIDANGQRFYASNGTAQLANIGYGQAKEEGGTYSTNPYYTFGYRVAGVAVGAYSVAEGYDTQAMGAYSHAEGWGGSDAQTAGGVASHAEGKQNYAAGDYSHVEGAYNIATGAASHVGGENNTAGYDDQTVIGYYNNNKSANAFEIGNGTSNAPANALEVTWTGNVTAAGDITDGNGNVLSNKIDASTLADYVTEQGTSGSWRYRKWHSGKIEAWFEGTFSCAASTTARGALYYSNWSLTIPSAIGFTAAPNTLIGNTGDSATVIAVNGAASSATAMSGKVWRYASSSSALTISAKIYAWQN